MSKRWIFLALLAVGGCAAEAAPPEPGAARAALGGGYGDDLLIADDVDGVGPYAEADTDEILRWARQHASSEWNAAHRLSGAELSDGLEDMAAHLQILDGLVSSHADEVTRREAEGRSVDDLRIAYAGSPLSAHLGFDAFLSRNRLDGRVRMDAGAVEAWIHDADYADLRERGESDYDDDGDLDLYLVNAPGGDNSLYEDDGDLDLYLVNAPGGDNSLQPDDELPSGVVLAGDADGDGDLELGLTGAPEVPPHLLIGLVTPAVQAARTTGR